MYLVQFCGHQCIIFCYVRIWSRCSMLGMLLGVGGKFPCLELSSTCSESICFGLEVAAAIFDFNSIACRLLLLMCLGLIGKKFFRNYCVAGRNRNNILNWNLQKIHEGNTVMSHSRFRSVGGGAWQNQIFWTFLRGKHRKHGRFCWNFQGTSVYSGGKQGVVWILAFTLWAEGRGKIKFDEKIDNKRFRIFLIFAYDQQRGLGQLVYHIFERKLIYSHHIHSS